MIRDRKKPHKPQKKKEGPAGKPVQPPKTNNVRSPGETGNQMIEERVTVDANFILLLVVIEDLLAKESLDANEWRPNIEHLRRNPRTTQIANVAEAVLWTMQERKGNGRLGMWVITHVLDSICAFDQESSLPPSDPRSLLQIWRKATGKSAFRPGSKSRPSRRRTSLENIAPRRGAERGRL